jgi:two-component system sensor histidine kinase EvgS
MMVANACRGILLAAAFFLVSSSAQAQKVNAALELTEEERAWIADNPELRVSVLEGLAPLEYLQNGQLKGLSAEFLGVITNRTGLRFTFKGASSGPERVDMLNRREVDLISSMRTNGPVATGPGLLHTTPYHVSAAIVVSRVNAPFIFATEHLNGLTVTTPYLSAYASEIGRQAPRANLIVGGPPRAMLQQVLDGTADVAVGTEAYLAPYLYREFQGQLQISGVLPGMTSEVGMTVRTDQRVLNAILEKALGSITPGDSRAIYKDWLGRLMKEEPTLRALTKHYPHELALVGITLLLLIIVAVQMHRMRQRAERNEREKTMFLAVMSHEIRSPMNSVLAAVELLQNTPLGDQQRHYAYLANNGAQSLLALIDDLLDITKLEAGQLRLEVDPIDVKSLICDTVELHQLRSRERRLSLSYAGPDDMPLLMLDDKRLGQVLHNLISNAIKFTEAGEVSVSYAISESTIPRHVTLRISVSDTGIGISEEAQEKLFQPYAQVARSYKRSGGTGLGLVISRDLITLMRGTITLKSELGKGTTFEIELPVMLAPQGATVVRNQDRIASPNRPNSGLRVLVVEDTPANQAVLQAQLEGLGCTAVIAQNGAEAIHCFSQGTYQLILMDCDLPDIDGYALTAKLRQIESESGQPNCPIIAISASTGSQHEARCFDAGMDGILSKPIRMGKLQDTIELWCGVVLEELPLAASESIAATLTDDQVIDSLRQDLHAILEASALRDNEAALRAAHRLRGAALAVEWPDVARAAEDIETLLRDNPHWAAKEWNDALHRMTQAFVITLASLHDDNVH